MISELGELRQEDQELEANVAYIERKVRVGVGENPMYYLAKEAQICSLGSRGVWCFMGLGRCLSG